MRVSQGLVEAERSHVPVEDARDLELFSCELDAGRCSHVLAAA